MSISQNSRLAVSITVLALLVSCFALSSRGTSRQSLERRKPNSLNQIASKPLIPAKGSAATSAQASEERQLEDKIPKHLPFSLKLRTEKERSFKDQENEKWVRDFELELKNTGDKPIYFIQFALVPDFGKAPSERTLALTIQYGRDKLVGFQTATAEDVPIKPGETVFLKVREMEVEGWEHLKEIEHWPDQWSKPNKVSLEFVELNFGDGTGFDGGDGVQHERRQAKHSALPVRIDKPPSKGAETDHHDFSGVVQKRDAAEKNSECRVLTDSLSAPFLSVEASSAEIQGPWPVYL